jgi:hypothetical protein
VNILLPSDITSCTAFEGNRLLRSGRLPEVALAVKSAMEEDHGASVLVFNDSTGRIIDLDLRGSEAETLSRLSSHAPAPHNRVSEAEGDEPRGRGRPKLGVTAREVTLLPRHWEWLAAQPGGASAVLRKLVEEARRSADPARQRKTAKEAAYHFMHAMAGDLPGFEEAARALFADDAPQLVSRMSEWPEDIRAHVLRLAGGPAANE